MLVSMALRNIFRNPRRTALMVLLIGSGLGTLILYDGLVSGMSEAFIKSTTGTFLGEAQIHREGFREEQEINRVIFDWAGVEKALQADAAIAAYAPRVMTTGMLASSRNVSGVAIYGIDPEREAEVSKVKRALSKGDYLSGASETEILIGSRLAELLEVSLGDRVVLTAAQASQEGSEGELSQELFRVSGIVQFNSRAMDQGMVFLSLGRAQRFLALNGQVHEVALQFHNIDDAENPALPFLSAVQGERNGSRNEVSSWKALSPEVSAILEMSAYGTLISGVILVLIISLSVINSMLMSIYERLFEFGVLKAVGTRPRRIAAMILLEGACLAVIAIVFGLVLGAVVSGYFSRHGFDFAGMEYAGTTLNDPIKTVLEPRQFVLFPVFVLVLTVVAAIYPAIHAARLVPAEALRKSL